MDLVSERRRGIWRQGILDDSTDAAGKALRHGRFDLFYGPFYLRYTRSLGEDGRIRLRLEERAYLVARRDGGTDLRLVGETSPRFVLEEVLPEAAAHFAGAPPLASGRRFFERAARLLDDLATRGSPRS
jgi:hypothetical protein